ncbi:MAG: FAD:protein FMN transferase [Prevotella sp.]|nr:FAD:protein FMN transferase [Prevotella sp.]
MMNERQKKRLLWQLPFLTLLIVGTVLIVRQQRSMPYQTDKGFVFGTVYAITYQSDENLKADIEAELQKVDNEFSMFNERSTVARINRGERVSRSRMFNEVYELAQTVNHDTDGAFDITVAPLVNAWGFGFKNAIMPTRRQVDSLLKVRNQYDFSAIAKGYGSDVVARLLRSRGISNFMVEIGGEVVTQGISERRLPWRIGVTKPVEDSLAVGGELQTVLNITDVAMATSGNYRNFYYKGGRKFAHTIDPKTGYPVQHSLLSATVLAKTCAVADAYATSFMVMGIERAKSVLERHPELMAYFIYSKADGSNGVWFSPSLKSKITE